MISYKDSGVDIEANARWVDAIQAAMRSTYSPRVPAQREGGFAGLFRLDYDESLFRRNYRRPVLVGCADGVGTGRIRKPRNQILHRSRATEQQLPQQPSPVDPDQFTGAGHGE